MTKEMKSSIHIHLLLFDYGKYKNLTYGNFTVSSGKSEHFNEKSHKEIENNTRSLNKLKHFESKFKTKLETLFKKDKRYFV